MEIEAMKKTGRQKNRQKQWKLLIIFIWILFIAVVSIGSCFLQRASVYKKAKIELMDQAEIISEQFTSLVDTNYYTRAALYDRMYSEVRSLSFALESYDDIGKAKGFLEDIVNTTEVKNLWIYDRDGNIVFGSGDAPECPIEPDYIPAFLDSRKYESEEYLSDAEDRYLITTRLLDKDKNSLLWGVKDKWLIYVKDIFSDAQKDVVGFFDWDQVLQSISIGRNGAVLAVSVIDGSVLSFSDPDARSKPVENLNIKNVGKKEVLSADQLLEEFSQMGEVKAIEVNSIRYYATRMNIDADLFLVMFPAQEIENEVITESVVLILPVILITGIGVIYVFCLAAFRSEQSQNLIDDKGRSSVLTGKLRIHTVLSVILVAVLSLYLETHLVYSRMFRYTSTTAEDVMQKKNVSDIKLEELHKWLNNGNLEKTRIAGCILRHADQGNVDRKYVSGLADSLNVSSLYVFDNRGKVLVTNAPYDGRKIDKDSPFHALLEGTESVILQPDQEDNSGKVQQETGVTMIDESNRVAGAVVTAADIIPSLSDDLSFAAVFQRVFLKDNTVVMAVDSENNKIRYFAQVDGSLLVSNQLSYDYTEADITALGVDESLIRDYYNGEMFALDNQYFASIRRNDNAFLMVLRPLVFIDAGNVLSVIFVTAATLIFFILLIIAAGRPQMIPAEGSGAADGPGTEDQERDHSAPDTGKDKEKDDEITLLENLTDRNKPYFEERWPADGKKWRARTSMEKFSVIVKLICIITLALLFLYILIAGENAVFYYSFSGYWSSGVNLYSITSCIFEIILLILLKEIIHKLLYLIARAAQRKGESICHLLDSFTGYILFIAGIFFILGTLGVNLTAMSLTAGVAGVIFGIGCQNIVADILAGIIMTFEGVACAGDFVSYNGKFALIQSVGVRTTKLKWFSEITFVRNNEFKNYISMPSDDIGRVVVTLGIDLKESLTRVESIIEKDLPLIHRNLCEAIGEEIACPKYRGVQGIEDSGIRLSFAVSCKGKHFGWVRRLMSRELLLMCERNGIRLEMPQIVINESVDV